MYGVRVCMYVYIIHELKEENLIDKNSFLKLCGNREVISVI